MRDILTTNINNTNTSIYKLYNYILGNNIYLHQDTNSIKLALHRVLDNIKNKCYKSIKIREERQKLRDDISDLERMFVRADNLDISEAGKNTGGKENDVELRHLKIIKLKQELAKKTNESLVLEKSLEDNKEMFRNIFDELLSENDATVMKLFYIDCWTTLKIATELYYTRDTIRQKRNRSINCLTSAILNYLQVKNIK